LFVHQATARTARKFEVRQMPKPAEQRVELPKELTHPDWKDRLEYLYNVRDPSAVDIPVFREVAFRDKSVRVRHKAAELLGMTQHPKALNALQELLRSENKANRINAVTGLTTANLPEVVPPIMAALKDREERVRETAAFAMAGIGTEESTDALLKAVNDPSSRVRGMAAWGLVQNTRKKSWQRPFKFFKALKHEDEWVRAQAAEALGFNEDPRAVEELGKALDDPAEQVREWTAQALGRIVCGREFTPHLLKALKDPSYRVRAAALQAFGKHGLPQKKEEIVKFLEDPKADVRAAAVFAVHKTQPAEEALPLLARALKKDRNAYVKEQAAGELIALGQELKGKEVHSRDAKALQLVGPHFQSRDEWRTISKAYHAALAGKITQENARLYVKQLRALKGSVK